MLKEELLEKVKAYREEHGEKPQHVDFSAEDWEDVALWELGTLKSEVTKKGPDALLAALTDRKLFGYLRIERTDAEETRLY